MVMGEKSNFFTTALLIRTAPDKFFLKLQKLQRNIHLDAFFVDNTPPAQYIHKTSWYIHKLNVPIENFRNLFYMY